MIKPSFTHFKVGGAYQYEWARKLGFQKHMILHDMFAGDTKLFETVNIDDKNRKYPKRFIFIGRLIEIKGVGELLKAWKKITDKKGWTLMFIGDGVLKDCLSEQTDILVKGYLQQKDMIRELDQSGCFVLPSTFEPWGVVIQEMTAAGLPMIVTTACGATPHFVINGYNGYVVEPRNADQLKAAMEKIIHLPENELIKMSYNSRKLGTRITQEISAVSLLSVIK
jgi:glycosyltransferase involved in cell wall biosynthesis